MSVSAYPTGAPRLQVFLVWQRDILLGYRLLEAKDRVSVGPAKRATFKLYLGRAYGRRFDVLRTSGGVATLRVGAGMRGKIVAGDQVTPIEEVLARPAGSRAETKGGYREVPLVRGERVNVVLPGTAGGDIQLLISTVDSPEPLRMPSRPDPLFLRIASISAIVMAVFAGVMVVIPRDAENPPLAISHERMVETLAPMKEAVAPAMQKQKEEKAKADAKSAAAKEKQGKLGRQDAKGDTVMPKGEKDVIREKVAKKGLLGIIGNAAPEGSGLGKLFAPTDPNEMEQAMTGLAGAKLAVGHGSGGLSTGGTGIGGGGKGMGRIGGTGDIDTGGGRGGRGKGPGLGGRGEKEVKITMETGNADSSGGLTREQIQRVVNAHKASVKYCYEKELQRAPTLAGTIDIYWIILPDGAVQKVSVAKSSMGNAAVEGCIARQVRQWQFPKSEAQTVVQKFPFIFKGA